MSHAFSEQPQNQARHHASTKIGCFMRTPCWLTSAPMVSAGASFIMTWARPSPCSPVVQKALNTEHHIGQGETWEQVLYQAAKLAASHVKPSNDGVPDIDWNSVKTAILKSCPTCAYDLQRWSVVMDIATRGRISNAIAKSYRISLVFNLISYRLFNRITYRFDSHHVTCTMFI